MFKEKGVSFPLAQRIRKRGEDVRHLGNSLRIDPEAGVAGRLGDDFAVADLEIARASGVARRFLVEVPVDGCQRDPELGRE